MGRPNVPGIRMPSVSMAQMRLPNPPAVSMGPEAFDKLIADRGVRMVLEKPVPCPCVRDVTAPSPTHASNCEICHNGFVYYGCRDFIGAPAGDSVDRRFGPNGSWDLDQVSVIVPAIASDGKPIDVNYFDQITLPDFSVRYYQRVEHSQSGLDRLQFPALSVDFVLDARGSQYEPGVDVVVENGRLRWPGQRRPGFDPITGRGVVYSVNYYTVPVFTVVGLPHQLRIAQASPTPGQNNVQRYFPQLAILRRDFIPFDQSDRKGATDRPEPKSGSFA